MSEIKEVKTEKTTVSTGEVIRTHFKFWYDQDYPYDFPHDYPIASETCKIIPTVMIVCASVWDMQTSKITFIARRSLPSGHTVLKHGIVITDSQGWENFKENPDELFVLGAPRTRKATGNTTGLVGSYTASLTCTENDTWYGRGWVTYKDTNGVEHTEYSDVTICEVTIKINRRRAIYE